MEISPFLKILLRKGCKMHNSNHLTSGSIQHQVTTHCSINKLVIVYFKILNKNIYRMKKNILFVLISSQGVHRDNCLNRCSFIVIDIFVLSVSSICSHAALQDCTHKCTLLQQGKCEAPLYRQLCFSKFCSAQSELQVSILHLSYFSDLIHYLHPLPIKHTFYYFII